MARLRNYYSCQQCRMNASLTRRCRMRRRLRQITPKVEDDDGVGRVEPIFITVTIVLFTISKVMITVGTREPPKLTIHIPFHAQMSVATPIRNPMADKALQPRPAWLSVIRIAATMPLMIPPTPRPRANTTRGLLPLQIVHRIKFGCD